MTDAATDRPENGDSPGALIRAAREKQGLHIAALAAAIKVSPRKLDALENDRWQELPDATFTRALAQTVCRSLKIDPRPVLERLPPADSGSLEQVAGSLNMPFQDRPGRAVAGVSAAAIRPMIWASALLAVAAVVVYFLPPQWLGGEGPAPAASSADTLLPPLNMPLADPASAPFASPFSAPPDMGEAASAPASVSAAAAAAAAAVSDVTAATGSEVMATETAATSAATVAEAPQPAALAAPAAAPAAGLVQLRANAASWVEANDATGRLLLSRELQPGERLGLDGALPIRLVIGNAESTELLFRNQPVDLAPLTRNKVARVELR